MTLRVAPGPPWWGAGLVINVPYGLLWGGGEGKGQVLLQVRSPVRHPCHGFWLKQFIPIGNDRQKHLGPVAQIEKRSNTNTRLRTKRGMNFSPSKKP